MRGGMSMPDSYAEYPMLDIHFATFRLRKYPFDTLRNDIVWPPAYVVLNSIMRRLQTHRYLKGNANAATIAEEIRKAIAPNLEVPSGMEGEVLEIPCSERKMGPSQVTKVLEGQHVSREIKEIFNGIPALDHAEWYSSPSVIRIVSEYPLRTQTDVHVFAQYLHQLWYIEKILVLVDMVPDSSCSNAAGQNSSDVWTIFQELQRETAYNPELDDKLTNAAVLFKAFRDEMEELQKRRNDCRTFIYSKIRYWLPKNEKVKIYRGTSALRDGSVKVSFNFAVYTYIKSAYISLHPEWATDEPYHPMKVMSTFECRHVTR